MFSALASDESYTKIDLARAYKQMKVQKECQPLLTINMHQGLYQYTRLPFGIMTAPSFWQKVRAQVLNGLSGVACYNDNILVTGCTREEHIKNLQAVLTRLQEYGLRVKLSKCQFFKSQLEFLGHSIAPEGIISLQRTVKSVLEPPPPSNDQAQITIFPWDANIQCQIFTQPITCAPPL